MSLPRLPFARDFHMRWRFAHSKYIKYQQVHSNKPMSGARSPSCRLELTLDFCSDFFGKYGGLNIIVISYQRTLNVHLA